MLFTTGIHIQLSREYGGHDFPVFEQNELKIGSDRVICHIHLAPEFGVEAEHVRLNRLTERDVTISPTSTSASVFLWRRNGRRHEQIYSTTALAPGDAFSVVSPQGPKFIFDLKEFPADVQEARQDSFNKRKAGTGRGRLNKDSMLKEGRRQIWTRLLVLGPMQLIQRASVFITSGAIFQPRNIFIFVGIMSGWIFGSFQGCKARKSGIQQVQTKKFLEDCNTDKDVLENMQQSEDLDFDQLSYYITQSTEIQSALKDDKTLSKLVIERAAVLAKSKEYDWLLKGKGERFNRFQLWNNSVLNSEEDKLDRGTAHILSWMGASKEPAEFQQFFDSNDEESCGRGPIRLSFRQAHQLGITAQPDAFYQGLISDLSDSSQKEQLIQLTLQKSGITEEEIPPGLEYDESSPRNREYCIYRVGDDKRSSRTGLLNGLYRQFGPNSDHLPNAELANGVSSRIAKLFAADIQNLNFTEREPRIIFDDQSIELRLDDLGPKGEWVMKQTAEAFARSLVLPCRVGLNGSKEAKKALFGSEQAGPNTMSCLVFLWNSTQDNW